ncbi:M23 family metallopeptidase [Streptomyces palmae]
MKSRKDQPTEAVNSARAADRAAMDAGRLAAPPGPGRTVPASAATGTAAASRAPGPLDLQRLQAAAGNRAVLSLVAQRDTVPAEAKPGQQATTYTVVSGDSLSKIAAAHRVKGGWQALYAVNRAVIGGNPDLIYPGQRLTIPGPRSAAPPTGRTPAAKPPATTSPSADSPGPEGPAPGGPAAGGFVAPVDNHTMGTPYRKAGSAWSSGYHTGVDFPVPAGTAVKAIGGGKVVSAGWGGAYGNQVVIRHADGKYSQYAHLSSLSVSAGQTVTPGQQLGLSGATGNAFGPHLHFEVRTGPGYGSDIDPLGYLHAHGANI